MKFTEMMEKFMKELEEKGFSPYFEDTTILSQMAVLSENIQNEKVQEEFQKFLNQVGEIFKEDNIL